MTLQASAGAQRWRSDGPRINRILFPYMEQRTRDVIAAGGRFVYYTTAETATSILRNRQVWMRRL